MLKFVTVPLINVVLTITFCTAQGLPLDRKVTPHFEEQIRPLLQRFCSECHAPGKMGEIDFLALKTEADIEKSWKYAMEGSRGDYKEVIIEQFVKFNSEITLLTVSQKTGPTLFCPPIGHRQERGDYQESWQPCAISDKDLKDAQD